MAVGGAGGAFMKGAAMRGLKPPGDALEEERPTPVLSKAQRERIFLEECAARGVDPIPRADIVARRRRALSDKSIGFTIGIHDAFANEGLRQWVLYGDMSTLDEPYYTYVNDWEKREGLQG